MGELSDYVTINLVCVAVLVALGLRRFVRMERFHWPRVVILTGILWMSALYVFSLAVPPQSGSDCLPLIGEPRTFCITE